MKLTRIFFIFALFGLCSIFFYSFATDQNVSLDKNKTKVTIYFFWGDGCPHCAKGELFLQDLVKRYSQVELKRYEVYYSSENQRLLKTMGDNFGFEPRSVPSIFIGEQHFEGFNDIISHRIEMAVKRCLEAGCIDKGGIVIQSFTSGSEVSMLEEDAIYSDQDIITVPFFGKVNLNKQSLLASTLIISFVDGVNPCSIWVLTILLAITLHSGSRSKIIIIGFVYIFVTAFIYALFIAGLFTMFSILSYLIWIQSVVALTALIFALVNIKDYLWYKEGLSFTISDEKKPGIYKKIYNVMQSVDSIWVMVGATVVLAVGVSLVEFTCTAGFPVLWSNLLISQNVTSSEFVMLLLVYLLVYQLDELLIFFVAVFSLRAFKMEEKHGRILKLIGGMLMLTLALTMLIKPSLMNKLSTSLIVFGITAIATLIILFLHRVVLPKIGINIGSEMKSNDTHE
jgi:glutaredoxin